MLNSLHGDQTPSVFTGQIFINYLSAVRVPNPRNSLGELSFTMARALIDNLRSYVSMADLINDRDLLPNNDGAFPVDVLKRQVMMDSLRALGTEYPEYGIIAYSGLQIQDRPVASITFNKGKTNELTRYYPTPEFHKLVKRI